MDSSCAARPQPDVSRPAASRGHELGPLVVLHRLDARERPGVPDRHGRVQPGEVPARGPALRRPRAATGLERPAATSRARLAPLAHADAVSDRAVYDSQAELTILTSGSERCQVVNRLGTKIHHLLLCDEAGQLFAGEGIQPLARAELKFVAASDFASTAPFLNALRHDPLRFPSQELADAQQKRRGIYASVRAARYNYQTQGDHHSTELSLLERQLDQIAGLVMRRLAQVQLPGDRRSARRHQPGRRWIDRVAKPARHLGHLVKGMATANHPLIELAHLHRNFGRTKAVCDVSFQVGRGEVFGYIGPNGAGKTTSMRILATLDVPTAGDALVDGFSVSKTPIACAAAWVSCPTISTRSRTCCRRVPRLLRPQLRAGGRRAPAGPAARDELHQARRAGRKADRRPVQGHEAAAVPGPGHDPRPGRDDPRRAGRRARSKGPHPVARDDRPVGRRRQVDPRQLAHPHRAGRNVRHRGHHRAGAPAGGGHGRRDSPRAADARRSVSLRVLEAPTASRSGWSRGATPTTCGSRAN